MLLLSRRQYDIYKIQTKSNDDFDTNMHNGQKLII